MASTHWDPDFLEEVQAEESPLDPAYPLRGRPLGPARVAGRLVRYAMEGPKELGRIWDRAKQGKATLMDSITGAMAGINPSFGPGFGAGPRMKAAPWQSRTLDAILGESPVGKKFPQAASPQTWISKLKGAGLPGEEVKLADEVLGLVADPRGKLERRQVAELLERTGLPELGVTRTELGGPKWEAAQKRLPEIGDRINELKLIMAKMQQEAKIPEGITLRKPADAIDTGKIFSYLRRNNPEFSKLAEERAALIAQQSELANWSAGKRPGWPEHNIEELKSPREVLYHAPPNEGGEYSNTDMRVHYPGRDKNLLFHQREGILELPDGKKSTHISEQQSDWISAFEKSKSNKGIKNPYDTPWELDTGHAVERFENGRDFQDFVMHNYPQEEWNTVIQQHARQLKGEQSNVPEPPMKDNWWKMGLKDAVKRAVEAGHDYLTWDTPETIVQRGGDRIKGVAENHYGKNVPGFLKKEYGVEAKRVPTNKNTWPIFSVENEEGELFQFPANRIRISETMNGEYVGIAPNGMWVTEPLSSREAVDAVISRKVKDVPVQEVFQIPITEEMKRKVLLEGQYFSKRTAKPGGRDAEGVA